MGDCGDAGGGVGGAGAGNFISAVVHELQGIKKELRVNALGKQVQREVQASSSGSPPRNGAAPPRETGRTKVVPVMDDEQGKEKKQKQGDSELPSKAENDGQTQVEEDTPVGQGQIIAASDEGYVQLERNKKFYPCATFVVLCEPINPGGRPFKKLVFATYHGAFCTMAMVPCEGMYVINGQGFFECSFPGEVQKRIEYRQVKRQLKKETMADFGASGMALLPQMWLGAGLEIGVLEAQKQEAKGKDTREPLHVVRTNLDGLEGVDTQQVRSSIFVRPTATFHLFELERLLLHAALPPGKPDAARNADDLSMDVDEHFAGNQSETSWLRRRDQEEDNAEEIRSRSDYFTGAGPKPFGWQDHDMMCCFPLARREIKRTAINAQLVHSVFSRGRAGYHLRAATD